MKFAYPQLLTVNKNGCRLYDTPIGYLPSITTILGHTVEEEKKTALNNWRNSLGTEKADKILNDAGANGTAIHLLTERFLKKEELFQGEKFKPEDVAGFNALRMKLNKIDLVWGQEMALYSSLLRIAGRCDCAGLYKGIPSIIDFKTSIRLKNEQKIEDYKLQLCAYKICHDEMFNTNIERGVILMVSAGGFPQEFIVPFNEDLFIKLINRVNAFYDRHKYLI